MSIVPYFGPVPHRKFARDIERRLPDGYRIAYGMTNHDGRKVGKHPFLFDPDGNVVRSNEGIPITIAGTPGAQRTLANHLARINKAGVPTR